MRTAESGSRRRRGGRGAVRFIYGEKLWSRIRQLAEQSQKVVAAVGFVGRSVDELLPWPKGSVVIADLSESQVEGGSSSAEGALRLLKAGVEVRSLPGLHAKVLVFDRHAVVGSMNLSESSSRRGFKEAGIVFEGSEVAAARRYVEFLRKQAKVLNKAHLEKLAKLERERSWSPGTGGGQPEGRRQGRPAGQGADQADAKLAPLHARKAFLFTWNPVDHPNVTKNVWRQDIKKCRSQGSVEYRWSCGVRQDPGKVPEGSLAFLIRLGRRVEKQDKGIVAAGRTVGELFRDEHWKDPGREATYVRVKFEVCSDEPLVPLEELEYKWGEVRWTPQASGTEIPLDVAQAPYRLCWQRWKRRGRTRQR
jgi:hypothetical protein